MILSICPNPSIDTYAWLEQLEPGKVNRIGKLQEYPGGKGTHVAMALKELGANTNLLGIWAGYSGSWIRQKCEEIGIVSGGITVSGTSRKCYTFRSQDDRFNNTELLEPGPELSQSSYARFRDVCYHQFPQSHLICISGSWPHGAPDNACVDIIELAKNAGKKIIVDCSGAQLIHIIKQRFFGIHLNETEALALGAGSIEDALAMLRRNIELVAITKGADGLWLTYNDQVIHANVDIENVISTVGSGDCLTAGMAYAVHKGFELEDIARYAVACGAANCLYEGIGQLKINDVESLLPNVKVKVMAYGS